MNKHTITIATVRERERERELYFREHVGANTSVCSQKNQNNIITINKHKSNVVGVGVPDDPLKKKKYTNKLMSNIQHQNSNLKIPISNSAITLIALIITIIVLLILAGVTLSMVMGESGLFGKANKAKEQTQISTAKEIIRMQVLENEAYKSTNDPKAKSDEELLQSIEDKLTEEGFKIENGKNVPYAKWCTIGKSYSDCSDDENAIPVTENIQINTYHGFYVARYEAGLTRLGNI